jgi:hypothetical protein
MIIPADELQLATERLSASRTGFASRPTLPDPTCERLGAIGGFGLLIEDHCVRLSVYLFKEWGQGQHQADALAASMATSEQESIVAVNGSLLFLGTAPRGDDTAHFALNDLCSAFAGQE